MKKRTAVYPAYYEKFKCKAGECSHTCCALWEVDVDRKTLKKYKSCQGEFGERLRNSVSEKNGEACINLNSQGRCVFLNADNLCDIIINKGEDYLCDICRLHPRFVLCYENFEEWGLGLCCEEACRLILGSREPFELKFEKNATAAADEADFLNEKESMLSLFENNGMSINEKIGKGLEYFESPLNLGRKKHWIKFFEGLEILDSAWKEELEYAYTVPMKQLSLPYIPELEYAFCNLGQYLVYRHFSPVYIDEDPGALFELIAVMMNIIQTLCAARLYKNGNLSFEDVCDISRMFSSEIEYDDANIDYIFDEIAEEYEH